MISRSFLQAYNSEWLCLDYEPTLEDLPLFCLPPQDNLPVIDLIARKPVGILHLLDDESNFPKATDHSFLEKCHYNHALNELYSRWANQARY